MSEARARGPNAGDKEIIALIEEAADEIARLRAMLNNPAENYEWSNGGKVTMDISGFSDEEVAALERQLVYKGMGDEMK